MNVCPCLDSFQNVTAYASSLNGTDIKYTFSPRGNDSNWFGLHKLGDNFVVYIMVSVECRGHVALWHIVCVAYLISTYLLQYRYININTLDRLI